MTRGTVIALAVRIRVWFAWKVLPRGYVVGRRTFGGVVKEVE